MRAAVRSTYGSPEVLSIKEMEKPTPRENEVLVRVYATSVSRTDNHILTGMPLFMRFFTGLMKPGMSITGTDFAGQVEEVGKDVTSFKPGDKVIGFEFLGLRSHAHYLVIPERKDLVKFPDHLDYDQAAACIEGAFYALNVIKRVNPSAGQKALVYGATGAIGSSAVQFLKHYGTYITAVCKSENSDLVRSLGADKIIDYTKEDFTKDEEKYDFVLDAVGKITFNKCKHLLTKNGVFSSSEGLQNIFLAMFTPLLGGKKVIFSPPKNTRECLSFIIDLVEKGKFKPVIDRKYPLEKIAEAFTYVASGQKIGNVILTMGT